MPTTINSSGLVANKIPPAEVTLLSEDARPAIRGKGNKLRRCQLWFQTHDELSVLTSGRNPSEHVFLNHRKQPITQFGIHTIVVRYAKRITRQLPSIGKKRVSPHTRRHTTATHLLRAGVAINTIRAWLGHISINNKNIYTVVDLEMLAKALAFV